MSFMQSEGLFIDAGMRNIFSVPNKNAFFPIDKTDDLESTNRVDDGIETVHVTSPLIIL